MKAGEKFVLGSIAAILVFSVARSLLHVKQDHERDIPYYSTASREVAETANEIYRANGCKECHSLWTMKDMMESVPAPILDGIGSIRDEAWLYGYLSSENPQSILPSRLKKEYRMPSYAGLPQEDRRVLAEYLASLKVKDWYLEQTRKAEYEKLTGKEYKK